MKAVETDLLQSVRMYSSQQLEEIFNCSKNQITLFKDMGLLKPIKTGKCYMYSYDEIKAFQERFKGMNISNKQEIINSKRILKERESDYNS